MTDKFEWENNDLVIIKHRKNITDHTGSMIALFLPRIIAVWLRSIADELNLPKNTLQELPENIHLTLAFFPDNDFSKDPNAIPIARDLILSALDTCDIKEPWQGTIQGYGVFNGGEDGPVLYASLDLPKLNEFRARICTLLDELGLNYAKDHDFTPHVTLAYLGDSFALPEGFQIPDLPVTFLQVFVAANNKRYGVPIRK